jgi:hypothetical protein
MRPVATNQMSLTVIGQRDMSSLMFYRTNSSFEYFFIPKVQLQKLFFTCHIWNMKEVLVLSRKMKKIIAYFHVLGLFIAKKHDLDEKKNFRLSRAGAGAVVRRNLCHAYSLP